MGNTSAQTAANLNLTTLDGFPESCGHNSKTNVQLSYFRATAATRVTPQTDRSLTIAVCVCVFFSARTLCVLFWRCWIGQMRQMAERVEALEEFCRKNVWGAAVRETMRLNAPIIICSLTFFWCYTYFCKSYMFALLNTLIFGVNNCVWW